MEDKYHLPFIHKDFRYHKPKSQNCHPVELKFKLSLPPSKVSASFWDSHTFWDSHSILSRCMCNEKENLLMVDGVVEARSLHYSTKLEITAEADWNSLH